MNYSKKFRDITINDRALVGGKNASLGEMIRALTERGIRVPDGFALTVDAYWRHLRAHELESIILALLGELKEDESLENLRTTAASLRKLIIDAPLPDDVEEAIVREYRALSKAYGVDNVSVAVRSSATAEDLPTASFAGQQETFLHVRGEKDLIEACKKCMASIFTERAMIYRREKGFDDMAMALSVGVQKMVNADDASSGVLFTLDTETGFPDVVMINGSYGLGELIVQGRVIPDEWYVHKPTLEQGFAALIFKELGTKQAKLISKDGRQQEVAVNSDDQSRFSLTDDEVLELARFAVIIEKYYSDRAANWVPMDIEWAKDSDDGKLYIVQARPETVHSQDNNNGIEEYIIEADESSIVTLTQGQSIGKKIVTGIVRVIQSLEEDSLFNEGDILVTRMTDPDWLPLLRKAGGVVTDIGGRTCHAAIVSRELNIPAVIGTNNATQTLKTGQEVTLDCSRGITGFVYQGALRFIKKRIARDQLSQPPCDILINLADPERAFGVSSLPVQGVGLARLEFIMLAIGVHPMAAALWDTLPAAEREMLETRAKGYKNPREFFVSSLAQGIAMIAAAFYPRQVVVRLSDFKTNEYKNLLGGALFEAEEENPMLGFRGAVRYRSEHYAAAFALECEAIRRVREDMGLRNVVVMIPFVRTVEEARGTLEAMKHHGLERGKDGLRIFMMVEVPSNVILIDQFAPLFDGLSIGSNDLTQLTLGVDRDSGVLAHLFDERDPAVKKMLLMAVAGARKAGVYISICGQAPSDFPEIAVLLIEHGINALSLNPDAVIPFLTRSTT